MVDAATGKHFFLECNCRIQVEHPVTEEVTGRDLVAEQLRIAAGEPLSFAQADIALHGHAVEARLTAEDVEHGFRPSPGRLERFAVPDVEGLRVDTHCADGTLIPPYYDSLMAKLIGSGPDRATAVGVLSEALERLEVEGVRTNRTLLRDVLAHEDFAHGFRPSPGRLDRFAVPEIAGLRVDTHCADGTLIPPHYDSLMAKLIGRGPDRASAVGVLRAALDGLEVEGVATNRALLAEILASDDFTNGAVTTRWLEEAALA